jgi:transposase
MSASSDPIQRSFLWIEKTKEELIDLVIQQQDQIKALQEKLEKLEQKQRSKLSKIFSAVRKKRWKKLGAPLGHPGSTRPMPSHIDETVHQTLSSCPSCKNHALTDLPSENIEHVQEDIVPARVYVTKFIRHGYWCRDCKHKQYASYAPEQIPYGYLGPNVLVHTLLFKYHHGLPYSKIKLVFEELCGLRVTESALAQSLQRLGIWLKIEEGEILKAVRASPHIHADETGWKIAGSNHWLWAFVNQRLALYKVRRSRGSIVPQEVLLDNYQGVVISDFLSAYNKIGRRRQRCLVHLLREMKDCRKTDRSEEYLLNDKKLRRILYDANRLESQRSCLEPWVFKRRLRFLKERLLNFSCSVFSNKNWQRLSKRFLKHQEELLTFLEIPGIPKDNNHAERMIRPNVIFRKISFQNMSKNGALAHETLMSLLQTLRLQNKNPIPFFKEAYLKHRKGNPEPVLSF